MSYIGRQPVPQASRYLHEGTIFTPTNEISIVGGYGVDNIHVYINGVLLPTDEYTANDGLKIVFDEPLSEGTKYRIEEFRTFEVAGSSNAAKWTNARTITLDGDLSGSVTIDGSEDVTLNAQVNDDSHNHANLTGPVLFSGSVGDSFYDSNIIVEGNGSTVKPSIGFRQPDAYGGTLSMLDANTFQFKDELGNPATLANPSTQVAASSTELGGLKARLDGTTLYLRNDATDA